jgi:hypothetical protein
VTEFGDETAGDKDTDTSRKHKGDDVDTRLLGGMVPSSLIEKGKLVADRSGSSLT